MNHLKNILIVLIINSLFYSCDDKPIEDVISPANTPKFNIDKFEQNIIDYVTFGAKDPIGWGYTISKDGQLVKSDAFGDARLPIDGQKDFTLNKEVNVASVSKFYTAIGAMQLIDANNLTIEDKIINWLPNSWIKGPGVNDLTFKDLLTHKSGLQSKNEKFSETLSYSGLRNCIRQGVKENYEGKQEYLNVNFALFRVLIPSLWSQLPNSPAIDIENDTNTQFMYLLYMQENVWDKIDLPLVGCYPENENTSTLYYNATDAANQKNGMHYGDWNPICGGGGYFMSLLEMAKLQAYFEHTEVLLSKELKAIMKTHRIGMDFKDVLREKHGSYYGKGGSISNDDKQGTREQIAIFPINGIDAVIMMNTQNVDFKDTSSLRVLLYNAYNNAWE